MKISRFVKGTHPMKMRVLYQPGPSFVGRVADAVLLFERKYRVPPNVCYVSMLHWGDRPLPQKNTVSYKRHTLLGEDEVVVGLEEEVELEVGDAVRIESV